MFKLFQAENMEVKYLYSFFIQRNQTMEAAPSNMWLKLDWCQIQDEELPPTLSLFKVVV